MAQQLKRCPQADKTALDLQCSNISMISEVLINQPCRRFYKNVIPSRNFIYSLSWLVLCWELLRQCYCLDLWIGPLPPPPEEKRVKSGPPDAPLRESQRWMSWPQDVPWYHQVPASPCSHKKKNFRCPIPPAEVHFLCPIPPAERHFPLFLCI